MIASCVTCQTHRIEIHRHRFVLCRCCHTRSGICRETFSRSKVSTIFSSLMHTAKNDRLVCLSVCRRPLPSSRRLSVCFATLLPRKSSCQIMVLNLTVRSLALSVINGTSVQFHPAPRRHFCAQFNHDVLGQR